MFDRISEKNRWFRDYTLEALTLAVRETIACFPVYRTYLAPGRPVSERGSRRDRTRGRGRETPQSRARGIGLQFSARYSALPVPGKPGRSSPGRARAFRAQVPADYRADHGERARRHGLLHLQPAGGAKRSRRRTAALRPERWKGFTAGTPSGRSDWPATLLATSTHDTKRSEDVRARMVAISEIPELWRRSLQPVAHIQSALETTDRRKSKRPTANEEYLLYQTLLGTWPLRAPSPS